MDKFKQLSISYARRRGFWRCAETAGWLACVAPAGARCSGWAGDVFAPDFVRQRGGGGLEASNHLAHLWLVPNPPTTRAATLACRQTGWRNPPADDPAPRYTYSTIALLRASCLASCPGATFRPGNPAASKPCWRCLRRVGQWLRQAEHTGRWTDVGTPERLAELNAPPTRHEHHRALRSVYAQRRAPGCPAGTPVGYRHHPHGAGASAQPGDSDFLFRHDSYFYT